MRISMRDMQPPFLHGFWWSEYDTFLPCTYSVYENQMTRYLVVFLWFLCELIASCLRLDKKKNKVMNELKIASKTIFMNIVMKYRLNYERLRTGQNINQQFSITRSRWTFFFFFHFNDFIFVIDTWSMYDDSFLVETVQKLHIVLSWIFVVLWKS